MQAIVAEALRASGRTLSAKLLASRVALAAPRRGFLIVPSYRNRVAVAFRGYATATATKKTPAKKTTTKPAASSTKKTATRKPAVAKKAATKAKPKATKKATKAKPKPKAKKAKKVLTPEEKAAAKKRELREASLIKEQPAKLPHTSWLIYSTEQGRGKSYGKDIGTTVRVMAEDFKKLSPAERQRLTERAAQNHALNVAAHKKWIESYPIDVIAKASRARARLVRVYKAKITPIKLADERAPKRPGTAFAKFVSAHMHETPAGIRVSEKVKILSKRWSDLNDSEKKAYFDLAAAQRLKYKEEVSHLTA